MTTPASHGPSGGGLTPPPAFDDGDTFDDLGVDGDAYLASLLDKAGGDLAAESQAALDDPDALAEADALLSQLGSGSDTRH